MSLFHMLLLVYIRLAKKEEALVLLEFGPAYEEYMKEVPAFIPHLRHMNKNGPPLARHQKEGA